MTQLISSMKDNLASIQHRTKADYAFGYSATTKARYDSDKSRGQQEHCMSVFHTTLYDMIIR